MIFYVFSWISYGKIRKKLIFCDLRKSDEVFSKQICCMFLFVCFICFAKRTVSAVLDVNIGVLVKIHYQTYGFHQNPTSYEKMICLQVGC